MRPKRTWLFRFKLRLEATRSFPGREETLFATLCHGDADSALVQDARSLDIVCPNVVSLIWTGHTVPGG